MYSLISLKDVATNTLSNKLYSSNKSYSSSAVSNLHASASAFISILYKIVSPYNTNSSSKVVKYTFAFIHSSFVIS